jgi:hypothetical protein
VLTEYEAQKIEAEIRRESDALSNRFRFLEESVMISHNEWQRLLREYRDEPSWALGVVLKCAACLLILVGIAVIGTGVGLPLHPPMDAVAGGAPATAQGRVLVVETGTGSAAGPAHTQERSPAPPAQAAH